MDFTRFELVVHSIVRFCAISRNSEEDFLQLIKVLLDKLKTDVTQIRKADKTLQQRRKDFFKIHTHLRRALVEKCRSVIDSNRKKASSSKQLYRMLGGESVYLKKKHFDNVVKYLLDFVLVPDQEKMKSKYKWSFERVLVNDQNEKFEFSNFRSCF